MGQLPQQSRKHNAQLPFSEQFRPRPLSPPVASQQSLIIQTILPGFDWTIARVALDAAITPDLCESWIKRNVRNRNINQRVVIQYGLDMIEGRFKVNGQPIIFNSRGDLHDGQHRISACIEAKTPFVSDVRFGADPDSFGLLDLGRKRSVADIAGIENVKHNVTVSAAAVLLWTVKNHAARYIQDPLKRPTPTQCQQFIWANRERLESAADMIQGCAKFAPPSMLCASAFLFAEQDSAKAAQFFSDMKTGAGLSETNPVRHLLRRLNDNRAAKAKLPPAILFALTRKAWVSFRDGAQMSCLRWRTDGPKPEAFPEI